MISAIWDIVKIVVLVVLAVAVIAAAVALVTGVTGAVSTARSDPDNDQLLRAQWVHGGGGTWPSVFSTVSGLFWAVFGADGQSFVGSVVALLVVMCGSLIIWSWIRGVS